MRPPGSISWGWHSHRPHERNLDTSGFAGLPFPAGSVLQVPDRPTVGRSGAGSPVMPPGGVRGAAVPVGMPRRERLARSGATASGVVGLPFPARARRAPDTPWSRRPTCCGRSVHGIMPSDACTPGYRHVRGAAIPELPFVFQTLGRSARSTVLLVPVPFALHPDDVRGAAIPDQPIEIRALFPLLVGEPAAAGHPVRSGCCEALWGRYSASGPAISRTCVDAILNGDRPVRHVSPDGPFPRKP